LSQTNDRTSRRRLLKALAGVLRMSRSRRPVRLSDEQAQSGGRRTIFGPDGAQSIENLRLLSRKLEEAEKDINRSRSATVLERQGIRSAARAFIAGLAGMGGMASRDRKPQGGIAGLPL
jgi:hypothetical protein